MSEEAELKNPNFADGAKHTGDTTNIKDSTHNGASHPNAGLASVPPSRTIPIPSLVPPHCMALYHFCNFPGVWCRCGPPPLYVSLSHIQPFTAPQIYPACLLIQIS
jgi:hypothetical protein